MAKSKKISKKAQTAPKISLKPSVKSTPFAAATKAASKVEETVKTMFKSVPKPEQMFDIEQIKTQMEKFGPSVFKGYEDIASLGKDNVEAAVKSSQSEFAKNSFDHVVAGTSKISDMAIKVANEAAEPISQRVNVAIEKITKAA